MKQQFGSLRSYLEMQHIVYSLSFPEDIAPDFIIRLRIVDNEEISSGPYSDGSDIDDDNDERDNGGNNRIVDDVEEEEDDDDDDDDDADDADEEDEVVDLKTSPTTATKKLISKDVTEAVYESDSASTKDNRNDYDNDYNPEFALIDKMTMRVLKIEVDKQGYLDDDIENMTKQDMRNCLYHGAHLASTDINDMERDNRKLHQKVASMETVPRLKAMLRERGQNLSGTKDILRDRYVEIALCEERYYQLITKWHDLKMKFNIESDLKLLNHADEDLNDSSRRKNTASRREIISKKIKLLTTKSLKEVIRLENKVRDKKNKNDTTIIDQERIDMIMKLLQAQLCSSEELIYEDDVMKGIEIEYKDYYFDSIIQSKNQNEKQNENEKENEYSNEKPLELYVKPSIDSSHPPTNIKSSRTSLKNQPTSTSTST